MLSNQHIHKSDKLFFRKIKTANCLLFCKSDKKVTIWHKKIPGKVFGGQAVGATGGEFSFQIFAPGQETGFLHTHKNHEELYFFLSGKGEFQVDGEVFPVEEGSVVRVAPDGKRSVRNNGTAPLVMLCVQYRGNTFTADDAADGDILNEPVNW